MKKRIAVLLIAVLMVAGCATTHQTPVGCENSIVHKQYPYADMLLTGAVAGCYMVAQHDPDKYALIQNAARQVEVLLQNPQVSYGQLAEVPNIYVFLTSQMATIFPPAQLIDKCDKSILLAYLKMI